MLLLLPLRVIPCPPANQRSVPNAEDVVPAVLLVNFQFWAYFVVSPDKAAVVR